MQYFVGIDIGTSSTKVVLANIAGEVVATAACDYQCEHPHTGWSEQDPELWYRASVEGVRAVVGEAGVVAEDVVGMSFGGQMHGLVTLDAQGEVIRPAILWNDGRSTEECVYLNDENGRERLTAWCGNIAFPGFTAPKLLWMKKNEPELFSRISMILLPKDYVAYRMTGAFSTDVSDASGTLYFDVESRCWSAPMLELLGISEQQLPEVYESWEVVGELCDRAAEDTGLERNVKVCAGAGDNAAAAIGMGVVREGQCNISLGTSGTVFLPTNDMHVDNANSLHSFCDAAGAYHLMGCILSAASANGWWVKDVLASGFADELPRIDADRLGSNSVLFLPYLMGERSPINDATARAAFVGMTLDTTRTDLVQAVVEGVAFALKQCFDVARDMGVTVDRLTICGGGAKNPIWKQIVADVFNMPLAVLSKEEGPGYGACVLAMVGCGLFGSVEEAVDVLIEIPTEVIEPDATRAARYERCYEIYRALYPALKDVYPLFKRVER